MSQHSWAFKGQENIFILSCSSTRCITGHLELSEGRALWHSSLSCIPIIPPFSGSVQSFTTSYKSKSIGLVEAWAFNHISYTSQFLLNQWREVKKFTLWEKVGNWDIARVCEYSPELPVPLCRVLLRLQMKSPSPKHLPHDFNCRVHSGHNQCNTSP